jgi:hypothetical protein
MTSAILPMSSSFAPCLTSVERQNSQIATMEAAPRKRTGAPQDGQFAVASRKLR